MAREFLGPHADVRRGWLVPLCGVPNRPQCGSLVLEGKGFTKGVEGAWVPNWQFDAICIERRLAEVISPPHNLELRAVDWHGPSPGEGVQIVVPSTTERWFNADELGEAAIAHHGTPGVECRECGIWRWMPLAFGMLPPLRIDLSGRDEGRNRQPGVVRRRPQGVPSDPGGANSTEYPITAVKAKNTEYQDEPVCRTGVSTGPLCGKITAKGDVTIDNGDGTTTTLRQQLFTDICAVGGDSGGPFVFAGRAYGVVSAGNFEPATNTCNPNPLSTFTNVQILEEGLLVKIRTSWP